MQRNTQAVVIGSRDIDEEDRLLTLLSREHGVIHAYAKSANRMRGRLAASTGLFCYSNFVLFHHKERYTVDHADSISLFFGLREDLEKLSLATYLAELTATLAPQGEPAEEFLRLLLNTLHLIEKGDKGGREHAFCKAVFELRALTLSGFMPNLVACRVCARFEAEPMYFYLGDGSLLCGDCRQSAGTGLAGALALPKGVLAAMRHSIYSPFEKLFSFTLPSEALRLLGDVTERYLIRQTEKSYHTLDFYREITETRGPDAAGGNHGFDD